MIWIVAIGTADQAGEKRGLRQRQISNVLVEVRARRFPKTIDRESRLLAQINLIAVERKDLYFRQPRFQNHRHISFGKLALQGALRRQEEILNKLLGNAGAALMCERRIRIRIVTSQQRADDAANVDSVMLEEGTIFGDGNCLHQIRRQVVKAYHSS